MTARLPHLGRATLRRRTALRIGVSALTLGLLLVILPFDQLVDAMRRVPPLVGLAALTTFLAVHLIGVIKWRLLINAGGSALSVRQAARCYYAGMFGNLFLPSIVGGDVVRAGMAFGMTRTKTGVVLGSLVDRALDIVGLAAVAGIGVLLVPGALDPQSRRIFIGLGALFVLGAFALAVLLLVIRPRRLSYRMRRRAVTLRTIARSMARRPGLVILAVCLGITLQTLLIALNAWLGVACGIDISFRVWLFVWPMAKIAALVPVTQGGIGVREAAQVALFAPFGVPAVLAFAAGLVFEVILISGALASGLIAVLLRRSTDGVTDAGPAWPPPGVSSLPERATGTRGTSPRARARVR